MKTVGRYTYGADTINMIDGTSNLIIGNFCSIASGLTVYLGGNHRTDWATTYPFGHIHNKEFNHTGIGHPATKGDVIIGNDVWIGANSTIMSGTHIGDGAVIAANSVVMGKIKPYAVVGGNPVRFYYFRFDQETINKLLKLKWWDLDEATISNIAPILCSDNFEQLFSKDTK